MRFFNFFLNHMVQKYQNEIAPIFYYGISTKTNEKDLKIPNLQALTLGRIIKMTLYLKTFCVPAHKHILEASLQSRTIYLTIPYKFTFYIWPQCSKGGSLWSYQGHDYDYGIMDFLFTSVYFRYFPLDGDIGHVFVIYHEWRGTKYSVGRCA